MRTLVQPHMRESLSAYTLVEIPAGNALRCFKLKRPADSFYLAYVLFTPFGIVIGGDIRFFDDRTAISSVPGYDAEWFGGRLAESYLLEKFGIHSTRGKKARLAAGWLCALQQKFSELYRAQRGVEARGGARDGTQERTDEPETRRTDRMRDDFVG